MKSFTSLVIKAIFFFLICFSISTVANAQAIIKGKVTDAKTGEPLIGATVHIEKDAVKLNQAVKLDGSYTFKNIGAGVYKLQVHFIGFKTTKEYSVETTVKTPGVLNVAMVDNSTSLNEITITEHASRESDNAARAIEKNGNNTMNLVSASTIAISPDVIISNVVGRVSGVSLDRGNTGDGQHVIIRGMDKKYNTTLINGVKIPSPDNKNRFVPLDIFPADLVENVEISKTLTPDMEADASGGVVNLVMKTAPDRLRVEGSFGTGYSQLFFDRPFSSFDHSSVSSKAPGESLPPLGYATPANFPNTNLITSTGNAPPNANVNLTIGNRFLNQKLGVLFSGTYQNTYAGNNSYQLVQNGVIGPAPDVNSQMVETFFQDAYIRKYSSKIDRTGLIASLDYKFNSHNAISLFATYIELDEHRVRETEDLNFGGYSYNGYHWTNQIDNLTETRSDLQNIYSTILKGEHRLSDSFKINWTVANSQASQQLPDAAEFDVKQLTSPVTKGGSYAHTPTPGAGPQDSTYLAPGIIYGPQNVGSESRAWRHNTDKDIAAYLDLHQDSKIFGRKALFGFGAMLRHKTRDNFNDGYKLTPVPDPSSIEEAYTSVQRAQFTFNPPDNARGSSFSSAGVYSFYENVQGAYGMVKYFISDKLNVIAGIRAENTLQHFMSSGNPVLGQNFATITYTDYLPTISAKYDLTDVQALRASYNQSIYRPTAFDLIPFGDNLAEGTPTYGNPDLQHTIVNNYDFRYEAFPGVLDEFMLGAFYKEIINAIESQYTSKNGGLGITPVNLSDSHNFGLEAVFKKFFGNFGVSANYTYTNSLITSTKKFQAIGLTTPIYVPQTRPLQGQAANVGNFSFLYKNTKNGLDAQIAMSYTGERINAVSLYKDLDIWEKATLNLDFSAQKQFKKHYIVFVKVNNLLNTPLELLIKQPNASNYSGILKYYDQQSANYTTVEYDKYYARYSLGFRFKF